MVQWKSLATALAVTLASAVTSVSAESHTIRQVNNCGYGTPTISQNWIHVSNGDYTVNGPLGSAIAWLNTGGCDFEAANCGVVRMTLSNCGDGSSVDISLIPPHTYKTPIRFSYEGGYCSGLGASCDDASCTEAFHVADDYDAQRKCNAGDANVTITYC